jgi:hypothetical protein
MEMACSSKTSIDFQRTTGRYISEDRSFQNFIVFMQVQYVVSIGDPVVWFMQIFVVLVVVNGVLSARDLSLASSLLLRVIVRIWS